MDPRDRDAISSLFTKLHDVEKQAGPRDAEAERFIADEAQRLPGAPYYMAQTIVMQDMALNAKQQEIDELKRRAEQAEAGRAQQPAAEGGFLSRMFGGGSASAAQRPAAQGGPWGAAPQQAPQYAQTPQTQYAAAPPQYAAQGGGFGRGMGGGMGGGGFLAGAAQTAMGVAGGVVLGNALGNMFAGNGFGFGGDETPAVQETTNIVEEAPQDDAAQQASADDIQQDDGYQDASYDDGGDAGFDDGMDEV